MPPPPPQPDQRFAVPPPPMLPAGPVVFMRQAGFVPEAEAEGVNAAAAGIGAECTANDGVEGLEP